MLAADEIVDIGKDAGCHGGNVVVQGNLADLLADDRKSESYTLAYLKGERNIPVPDLRRPWKKYIEVVGARENNLKAIDVKFPLGVMSVVTGVSGSGKSTLVREILYKAMVRLLGDPCDAPGAHKKIGGDVESVGAIEFVDQNPIGTSSRSNPATYLKAYDEIRKLFPTSRLRSRWALLPDSFPSTPTADDARSAKVRVLSLFPCSLWLTLRLSARSVMDVASSRRCSMSHIAARISMTSLR